MSWSYFMLIENRRRWKNEGGGEENREEGEMAQVKLGGGRNRGEK